MILDTSAVVAILFCEEDGEKYARAIAEADSRRMSAANFVETALLIEVQTGGEGSSQFDAFIRRVGIVIEPVTEGQAQVARQAFTDFGKGHHRAGLNLGDCFSYAIAKVTGEPLLFKGPDFAETDVEAAL